MTLSEFVLAFKALEKTTRGRCFYCGTQTARSGLSESSATFQTHDHVIPVSAEGTDMRSNRVVCCYRCNTLKANLPLREFKRRSGIPAFYAETLLGTRIDDLSDIETTEIRASSRPRSWRSAARRCPPPPFP